MKTKKFSYIAISKFETEKLDGVVLRHPKMREWKNNNKEFVNQMRGHRRKDVVTRKEEEIFKEAKKLEAWRYN